MLTRRRVIGVVLVLLFAALAYSAWLLYAAQRDLQVAEADARELQAAIEAGDEGRAQTALSALQESAGSADGHTGGLWWRMLTITPFVGDDLAGVRGLSASLDEIAQGVAPELIGLTEDVNALVTDGQVDLAGVESMGGRVQAADESMQRAVREVDRDSSGYVGPLRDRFDEYADIVNDTGRALSAARTATEVAPTMLGADGPRDYLLVFQNNAEIRATGGLSGAWARVRTEDGRIELMEQGDAGDFPETERPVAALTGEEQAVYGDVIGQYFQDPVMVPDFPRAAELFDAFWTRTYPDIELDGVVTVDTVGLSYLLRGTGPVTTDGYTLTPDTVVPLMLNQIYLDIAAPQEQDEVFTAAASDIFTAATSGVSDPTELVRAVYQAVGERRLLISSFEDSVAERLSGTTIAGEFGGDDGDSPHVDVTVNDATASKMSYYLDYDTDVRATSCTDGVQQIEGSMQLRQNISAADAAKLPDYITGAGIFGVEVGGQQTLVRIYAPFGGELGKVFLDGQEMPRFTVATIEGRQVITLVVLTDGSADIELTWSMTSGPGQEADGVLGVTPKVTPGTLSGTFASAC